MPKRFKGFEAASWLRHDEMARVVGLFAGLGVRRVRLTGGEPLLRRGVADLACTMPRCQRWMICRCRPMGPRLAQHLGRAAGVDRLNISLDTLDAASFGRITGRDCLDAVLAGLRAARNAGFAPIKLNGVVHAATPEDRRCPARGLRAGAGLHLRLIEPMPVGVAAAAMSTRTLAPWCAAGGRRRPDAVAGEAGAGPARYWGTGSGAPAWASSRPCRRHFCAACSRVRLGVDGTLYLCLGQEDQVPLGQLLRDGASDAELEQGDPRRYRRQAERHEFTPGPNASCVSCREPG